MRTLTPAERRAFRAKAHHLHPFVSIGQHGLTPAVLHEIDIALAANELIKIRVFNDERGEREALLARICDAMNAAPVQHLGKILTVWRPAPEPEAPVVKPRKPPAKGTGKPGRSKPQGDARRGRTAPAAPRAKSPPAAAGRPAARRRKPGPPGETPATFADESRARRRRGIRAPADPRGDARTGAKPYARRGPASAAGHEPAKRPPRGATSGKPRNRGPVVTGGGKPRATAPGARRRRTPR